MPIENVLCIHAEASRLRRFDGLIERVQVRLRAATFGHFEGVAVVEAEGARLPTDVLKTAIARRAQVDALLVNSASLTFLLCIPA